MMQRLRTWIALFAVLVFSLPASAVITRLTPLKEVIASEQLIFVSKVERLDPEKPAAVLVVGEPLKGQAPFTRLPINLTGDSEAQKEKHTPQLLKRLAVDLPVLLFASQRGKRWTAFGYTNGTWFQLIGHVGDDQTVRWAFTHCEPYLRRTFKGTTAELRQVVIDALKGTKAPPEPDPKEPPGLGPEVPMKSGAAPGRGPLLAVIPTFVLVGPLALLAALFPAIFGGLALVLKRWMVLLTVASINSTLFFAHSWFYASLRETWLGPAWVLWLLMSGVALLGLGWSLRRYGKASRGGAEWADRPRRAEHVLLALVSLAGLATVLSNLIGGVLFEPPWKELLVIWVVAWAGLAWLLIGRFTTARVVRSLPSESVMLAALLCACTGVAASVVPRGQVTIAGLQVRMVWAFEPSDKGAFVSSPLVVGDRVYAAAAHSRGFSSWGVLYCLDRASGKLLWTFSDDEGLKPVFSTPCVADGRLFIGEGFHQDKECKLYCLNAETGAKLWEFTTASHTESSPCVVEGKVYVGAGDDGILCLEAATGRKIWHFQQRHVDAGPVVVDGRLFAGSGVGDVYNTTEVFCLDATTGQPRWRLPVDLSAFGAAAVKGSHVYFGLGNGDFLKSADQPAGAVLCVEALTGRRLWRYDLPDGVHVRPAVDEECVYVGCRDGHGYALDRRDGRVRWKQALGSPIVASPALSAGRLYLAASGGRLACLHAADGTVLWEFDLGRLGPRKPQLLATPAALDGSSGPQIFLGTGQSDLLGSAAVLYCLQPDSK
ncbi:MAG: PQQ-like beta-propeller repeat protein [Gemmataceae bacterium]|nr:PQQ-like beta-propeller repeat protein [Gemmataceae bacterium]MDW8264340.1 PQQ-binding-like beta-propeller repeat protein [Gemmataceae bacterium]